MLRTTGALVGAAMLLATGAGPASGEDRRPCVSRVEYWSSNTAPDISRPAMEARWEVRGEGQTVDLTFFFPWADGPAWEAVTYPRCGYDRDEAWYGILYKTPTTGRLAGRQRSYLVLQWHTPGATAHGHLRFSRVSASH